MQDNVNIRESAMNVKELIEHLSTFDDEVVMLAFNCDGMAEYPITGSLYDDVNKTLELCTDTDEEEL